jgi:anti-sigma B factor antagonist
VAPVDLSVDADGNLQVTLAGDIAMSTAEQAARLIRDAIELHRPRSICVDLAAVTFLDSAGISTLVAARRAADDVNAGFQVTRATAIIDQLLDMTGLAEHFGMRPPRTTPIDGSGADEAKL